MDVFGNLCNIFKEIFGENADSGITPASRLLDDLKMNSISVLMMYIRIQNVFGVDIPSELITPDVTVSDVVAYIENNAE